MKKNVNRIGLIFCFIAVILFFIPTRVLADDSGLYGPNDILFYDPNDTGCATTTKLAGSDNRQKIYNFWISKGLTAAQAAGITSNIQAESGFSPFRQQDGVEWGVGGYGIAGFADIKDESTQRTAVTTYLKNQIDNNIYNKYYSAAYGGATIETNGFIPAGITSTINDEFLFAELNYLYTYITGFTPSTVNSGKRVSDLTKDQVITIQTDAKLFAFIKTVVTASNVAKAWTYLYEYPTGGNISEIATARATNADTIVAKYANASTNSCIVGVGGLSFEQAKILMTNYYNDRINYFNSLNPSWAIDTQNNQCTAFVYYFTSRFATSNGGSGNGDNVVGNILKNLPNYYESVTKDNLKPFSVFSLQGGEAGHTGIILGIESDGSVIIGEANLTKPSSINLLEYESTGIKSDTTAIVAAERWTNIGEWEKAMENFSLTDPTFAAPLDQSGIIDKIQVSLN